MNGEVVYTKPSGSWYENDVYHFTAGNNCKIKGGDQNMFDWDSNPNVLITQDASVDVTGVTLDKTDAQSINVGGSVAFTATVAPDGATDKTVKWSTTGGVTLYSDSNCTQAVGADATSTLTVYAKGTSAGPATVTATSNADSTKSASCNVTVNTKAMTVSAEDVNVTVDGQSHGITVNVTDPASGATVKYGTEEGSYALEICRR